MQPFFSALIIFIGFASFAWADEGPDSLDTYAVRIAFQEGLAKATYFENAAGDQLRYTHFEAPGNSPRGSIVFIQGRATFLEYYEVLVGPLLERGFDVWMYDLSGQGGSDRLLDPQCHTLLHAQRKQHIDDFNLYVADMSRFITHVVLPNARGPALDECPQWAMRSPLYLGGYSTGAHVALRYLAEDVVFANDLFKGVFLVSPLIALKSRIPEFFIEGILKGAALLGQLDWYVPGSNHEDPIFEATSVDNGYTSDAEAFDDLKGICQENLHHLMGGVTLGWVRAARASSAQLSETSALSGIGIPVLIATGLSDTIVDTSKNSRIALQMPTAQHRLYLGARHEIFREKAEIRAEWWQDFDDFLSKTENLPETQGEDA